MTPVLCHGVVEVTDEELKAAKALCDAATPGPWTFEDDGTMGGIIVRPPLGRPHRHDNPHDAAFIAAARTLVPKLLAEVERLRAENTVQRVVNMRAQSRISYLASLAGEGDE